MICDDVLSQLLDDELESEVAFAQRMSSSPPQATPLAHRLTPLRKAHRAPAAEGAFPLKPAAIVLSRSSLSEISPPSAAGDDSSRSESTPVFALECFSGPAVPAEKTLNRRDAWDGVLLSDIT